MFKTLTLCAAVVIVFAAQPVLAADSADVAPVITADAGLYTTFGGHDGLVKMTDDFMEILLADPRTHDFFVAAHRDHLKLMLVAQFCHILNGGCAYSGKDMKTAHAELGIDHAAFNALVEDLQQAMTDSKIPFSAQNRLLAALAPQHRDIITQ